MTVPWAQEREKSGLFLLKNLCYNTINIVSLGKAGIGMDLQTTKANLEAKGYAVACFASGAEAAAYLNEQIDGVTVGFGGSLTVQELGLYDSLGTHNTVLWHWRVPDGQTPDELRRAAAAAEVYISSANGLAETGEIVNIDGSGNRVASTIYGHKKVYFVIGENKLAPDLAGALDRARNIAAPKNARRLGVKTPCAEKGDRCYDCHSPARICRAASVFWTRPNGSDYEVVLIGEALGY